MRTAWINPWAVFLLGLPAFYRFEILSRLGINLLSDIQAAKHICCSSFNLTASGILPEAFRVFTE